MIELSGIPSFLGIDPQFNLLALVISIASLPALLTSVIVYFYPSFLKTFSINEPKLTSAGTLSES